MAPGHQILLVKIFSLNQKTNQILQATAEKIKFSFFMKTSSYSFMFLLISCKRRKKTMGYNGEM